ncbi:MAG: hypothetical protein LUQ65_11970, partial [Candidatus Helarchaeota archaeon]|nr:hypothetical protein [Candidatus Helarchaeota archaeon]
MQRKTNPTGPQQDKSIADLESELNQLQEKVKRQTIDIRKLLKNSMTTKQKPFIEVPTDEAIKIEAAKYNLEEAQAEFFATILTLEKLILAQQEGRLESELYNSQLKTILNDILKFKLILEKKALNLV